MLTWYLSMVILLLCWPGTSLWLCCCYVLTWYLSTVMLLLYADLILLYGYSMLICWPDTALWWCYCYMLTWYLSTVMLMTRKILTEREKWQQLSTMGYTTLAGPLEMDIIPAATHSYTLSHTLYKKCDGVNFMHKLLNTVLKKNINRKRSVWVRSIQRE